jgi:hypothetical protein
MRRMSWIQFTWDLQSLPEMESALPEHYQIARAHREEDEAELRKVISSSFTLDPAWNPAMREVIQTIESWLDRAFASEACVCLALRHGLRIIGASVLTSESGAENHLSPGPCILMEYRNRGFGARLLEESLRTLRDGGLITATAIAKKNSPVTKSLYKKFNSRSAPYQLSPLLAA